ncbi:MAG: tRNA (adenosine(37)-N6)-dimethylallyltransferase MiaA [bacterium TMED161]|nr:MAG: tRNA (adenosine(37)-N6)-dimethylallyltransferase MiaA [bacterium TMED161]|tara:strand:+ start:19083 stop:20021 length:939 start_codon:yes stop_codon:yes gene_type:complete
MTSNKKKQDKLIVITGPTASGKTSLASKLAYDIDSEIISADSRQIYKGMDIGTGKDLDDYIVNQKSIPYHLIDILDPKQNYSVYDFQKDFYNAYQKIRLKNKVPILCGGTGLYIESTLLNYDLSTKPAPDENLRASMENLNKDDLLKYLHTITTDKQRSGLLLETRKQIIRNIEILQSSSDSNGFKMNPMNDNAIIFATNVDREVLRQKIKQRLIDRINEGMITEVEGLIDHGLPIERLDYFGLEYKFIAQYLKNEISKELLITSLTTAIRKFAKRQRTWFRRMEKRGININWIEPHEYNRIKILINQYIES